MHKYVAWVALLLGSATLVAGQEVVSPQLPPPAVLPPGVLAPGEVPLEPPPNLVELRQRLELLKAERSALDAEVSATGPPSAAAASPQAIEALKLQIRLQSLLLKIRERTQQTPSQPLPPRPTPPETGPALAPPQPPTQPSPKPVQDPGVKAPPEAPEPVNALSLAQALFQAGKYEPALKAYRTIDLTGMKAEERAPIQYLTATCLRKLGKSEEAATLYREVANCRGDEQVASCAQWQLNMMRWRQDWNARLQAVRERRQAPEKMP